MLHLISAVFYGCAALAAFGCGRNHELRKIGKEEDMGTPASLFIWLMFTAALVLIN
jgi:hypothetical protein